MRSAGKLSLCSATAFGRTMSDLAALKQDAKSFLPPDGVGAPKTPHAGSLVCHRQDAAAKPWPLATQHRLLRQPGQLLHRLRFAAIQARPDQPLFAVLCLAALPTPHGQCGGSLLLPHAAARRRHQGRCQPASGPNTQRTASSHATGGGASLAVCGRLAYPLTDATLFGTVRDRAFRIMPEEKLRSTPASS